MIFTDIYAAYVIDEAKAMAGCGVVVFCSPDDVRVYYREFAYPLGNSSAFLCALQTVRLALSGILPKFRKVSTTVFVDSDILRILMMDTERLVAMCSSDNEMTALSEMMKWVELYPAIEFRAATIDEYIIRARRLATDAITAEKSFDSETSITNAYTHREDH